jgi:uncharacterized protein
VIGSDGLIRPDPAGRQPGRGAYVHRDVGCIEIAVRRGTLARALRVARVAPDAGGAARLLEALRTAGAADSGRTASTDATARTTEGR